MLSSHINGPLYAEAMGCATAPVMLFVHPNPMDSRSWLFQMAHFSTWYRCIAVDLPGYGWSPSAVSGLTLTEVARACWEAVDRLSESRTVVLVGSSVGSNTVQHMYHLRPEATDAVILSGAGWRADKEYARRRIASYRKAGADFRREHMAAGMSDAFAQSPLGDWVLDLISERNRITDIDTVITLFDALEVPDPEWLQHDLDAPVLILSGTLDSEHEAAHALRVRLPRAELTPVRDAGHYCHLEQPWVYDREMIRFLRHIGHTGLPVH